jgi:hypothetical protein
MSKQVKAAVAVDSVLGAAGVEVLAANADTFALLWNADMRERALNVAVDLVDGDTARADAERADGRAFDGLAALLAAQSDAERDGTPVPLADRVRDASYAWFQSVRGMVLEQYRVKRPGLTPNAYDKAWSRGVSLLSDGLDGGFVPPKSDNADAVRKAQQRADAKAKVETAQRELMAAFESMSDDALRLERKAAFVKAGEGDAEAEREAERIKRVLELRGKAQSEESEKAIATRWDTIRSYGKRKVDSKDNPLFVSDLRTLDSVIELLQSR